MWYSVDAADPQRVIRFQPEETVARERLLHRALRPNSLATLASSAIEYTISTGREFTRQIRVRGEIYTAATFPVHGPDLRPMAVQLWVAGLDVPREPAPKIDAFVWDGGQWTVMSSGAGGAVLPAGSPMLHGAWFLSRIIECEERDRLITAALDPRPHTTWSGPMRVLTADNTGTTRVFGYVRYHSPDRLYGLLLEAARHREPGVVLPTYRNDAAAALMRGTTALVDLDRMQIIEWLTPPLRDIAWRHHPTARGQDPTDRTEFNLETTHVIHPEDHPAYLTAMRGLASGKIHTHRGIVRLLTLTGGWQSVELYHTRLPQGPSRFLIVRIRPIDADDQDI